MNTLITRLAVTGLALTFVAPAASARDNDNYGETRLSKLPKSGVISKNIWVGSWWGYRTDGIAYRVHDSNANTPSWNDSFDPYQTRWDRWDSMETSDLSPAEKFDKLVGRLDKVEYAALIEKAKKNAELDSAMTAKIDERRDLVRTLNKMIRDNQGDASFRWSDTDEGKRYTALNDEIKADQAMVDAITVDVDTATEYEVLKHGTIQFGVQSWFGHCNAWAAAAIMEPEPRLSTTVDGIEFTAGDVKAYVTEAYMEIQSSFHGSRNEDHETEEGRDDVSFKDMTPAGFHIVFADQVGNRDKSFVIDRYTGSQVWNQPVKAYRVTKQEPLYENDQPLKRMVNYTNYGYRGATTDERGEQDVYPVLFETTIHWVTDGLPHERLTVDTSDLADLDDETFSSSFRIGQRYEHQIEIRTLTYELWLDKPMTDPEARIVGDGAWQHGAASDYTALHPDFIWQPLANVNNAARDYENEWIDYAVVKARILPGTLEQKDDPTVTPGSYTTTADAVAIPDADKTTGAAMALDVADDITVGELKIDVDITHTYIGDLQVRLVAPDGKSKVIKRFGDGRGADDIKKTYDVPALHGVQSKGTWSLEVKDQWRNDTGTINSFTLHIK